MKQRLGITAVIPTIPPRGPELVQAMKSVTRQQRPPDEVIVPVDTDSVGSAANRNRGIEAASCRWVAFLDDDDIWYPSHLRRLMEVAMATDADLVYPWFDGRHASGLLSVPVDGQSHTPEGVAFGNEQREHLLKEGNFIPVTVLARTELLLDVGGFTPPPWASPNNPCEDWGCWIKLLEAGAKFVHLPERTWEWRVHGRNTSGRVWTQLPWDGEEGWDPGH